MKEALKLALEALETWLPTLPYLIEKKKAAINAIKQALALDKKAENARELGLDYEPVLEPVAGQPLPCPFCGHIGLDFSDGETYRWGVASCGGCGASCGDVRREYPDKSEWHIEAIAEWNRRSPAAQRQWVGLTDEEITAIVREAARGAAIKRDGSTSERIAQAVEAKLKEKNT
jgi:hypothetical protein